MPFTLSCNPSPYPLPLQFGELPASQWQVQVGRGDEKTSNQGVSFFLWKKDKHLMNQRLINLIYLVQSKALGLEGVLSLPLSAVFWKNTLASSKNVSYDFSTRKGSGVPIEVASLTHPHFFKSPNPACKDPFPASTQQSPRGKDYSDYHCPLSIHSLQIQLLVEKTYSTKWSKLACHEVLRSLATGKSHSTTNAPEPSFTSWFQRTKCEQTHCTSSLTI